MGRCKFWQGKNPAPKIMAHFEFQAGNIRILLLFFNVSENPLNCEVGNFSYQKKHPYQSGQKLAECSALNNQRFKMKCKNTLSNISFI